MFSRSSVIAAAVLCGLAVALTGCSSSSFVGRQFSNFTAYYNGFYNAKQAFREGVNGIENNQEPINPDIYLSLFPQASASSAQSFDSAIKKSADLLRNHPQSKWVDEALLLIGKSYYYQQNYVGSEQKFREVITLESGREEEARFWLARTLMASGEYTEAIDLIRERLSAVNEPDEWTRKMQMVLGELHVRQEQWSQAAEALETGLDQVDDNRLGARGQFLLGQVYETLNAYGEAASAYDRVQEFNPLYELSYASRVHYCRVVGLHDDPERALRVLGDMQRDDKHFEKRSELALLRARVLQAAGQPYDARQLYESILYGDEQLGGQAARDVTPRVYYRLAELYRDELNSYQLASAYFDSAATGGRRPPSMQGQDVQYVPDAIVNVSEQADRYQQFTRQMQEISRLDSLLHLGSLRPAEFDSVIQQIRIKRAREAREREARRREQLARQNFRSRSQSLRSNNRRNQSTSSAQSAVAAARSGDAGFLFHEDPVQLQQSRSKFQLTWGDRPLVPNWRRRAAVRGQTDGDSAVAATDSAAVGGAGARDAATAMLPPVNTSDVPRDSAAHAEMRDQRAQMWYRLGNTLFLQMNQPDSAATWYRKVIADDETRPVAQRAYYALSEVFRTRGDTTAVRRLYEQITNKYPSSSFARRIQTYREGVGDDQVPVLDSLQRARESYAAAYDAWQNEAYGEAVDRMLTVARTFNTTGVAPRALLAAGYIYLEWAEKDSLDPRSAIPLGEPSLCCSSIIGLAGNAPGASQRSDRSNDSLFIQPVYLKTLYASLERSYPGTPHAARARRIRESVLSSAAADSAVVDSAAGRPDSLAVDSTTRLEQTPPSRSRRTTELRSSGTSSERRAGARQEPPSAGVGGENDSVTPSDTSASRPVPDRSPPSQVQSDTSTPPDTARIPTEQIP